MATNSLAPVQYGTVVGRFVSDVADTPEDEDTEPDFTPLAGTVTFTPMVKALLVPTALPDPATVLPTPIVGVLDSTGHLRLRMSDGTPAAVPGVTLIATDDPATNPTGFTYKVSFALKLGTVTMPYDPFSIAVPAGETVNLSKVAPVPSTSGSPIVQGPAGEGVPDGGTTGQVLVKTADTDFATAWADPSGSGSSTVDGITDASTVGKEILKASDAAAVLAITGAQPAGSYATSAQGALADTAVQPGSLAAVATSGAYSDLTGQPAIPSTAQDVGAVPTSRTVNGKPLSADVVLGAGDVGAQPAGSYATAAQGAKADTAVQPGALATVATSGAYSDLTGRPTLGTASGQDSTAFATAAQGAKADTAVQPAALSTVATSGAYSDLSGQPSIPNSPDDIGALGAGYAGAVPGTRFTALYVAGVGWPARPTGRTDVFVDWVDVTGEGTDTPAGIVTGDQVIRIAVGGEGGAAASITVRSFSTVAPVGTADYKTTPLQLPAPAGLAVGDYYLVAVVFGSLPTGSSFVVPAGFTMLTTPIGTGQDFAVFGYRMAAQADVDAVATSNWEPNTTSATRGVAVGVALQNVGTVGTPTAITYANPLASPLPADPASGDTTIQVVYTGNSSTSLHPVHQSADGTTIAQASAHTTSTDPSADNTLSIAMNGTSTTFTNPPNYGGQTNIPMTKA